MNISSWKEKSPWTNIQGINLLNKFSKDKSPWTNFKKMNDEKFSKDFIKIKDFSFWRGSSSQRKEREENHTSQNSGIAKLSSFKV